MKTNKNPFIEAAKQATSFGRFCPYVRRCGGALERYSNTHYGLVTPAKWVTGTKEQILEEVHQFITNYTHED